MTFLIFVGYLLGEKNMKKSLIILCMGLLMTACGQGASKGHKSRSELSQTAITQSEPTQYTYRVKATYPHSRTAYTQGLQFLDGQMWEGTGQHGKSRLQTIDLKTGRETILARLPRSEFGEGITVLGDKVFQLTWQSNKAYVYDLTGREIRQHRYMGEGWGLTSDGTHLYMTDGTDKITKINPANFKIEGRIYATYKGQSVQYLNELEWIDGKIWANIYTTDRIAIINPQTGVIEGMINLEGLLSEEDYTMDTDVLNGIAWDKDQNRIFVTGKNWPKLFEIEIIKQ